MPCQRLAGVEDRRFFPVFQAIQRLNQEALGCLGTAAAISLKKPALKRTSTRFLQESPDAS